MDGLYLDYNGLLRYDELIKKEISNKVIGPSSSINTHVAVFDGTTGKLVKDSGFTIGKSVPSNAVFTDTTYNIATTSADGLMDSEDKTKLDGIEVGAQVHKAPTAAEVKTALGTGSGTSKYLREDGTWAEPASSSSSSIPTYLGECNSEASEQAKVATVDNSFSLVSGVVVSIKYANTNTYSSTEDAPVTLNVNNTGAKQIYYNASLSPTGTNTSIYGYAGRYITYIYNGEYWVWFGHSTDSNTTYSAGTAALLTAGTNTTNRTWQAKILHDYMSYPNLVFSLGTQSTSGAVTIDGSVPLHVITCTGNVSSVALSTNPAAGHSCHVIFTATSARTVSIAHDSTNRVCPEAKAVTLNIKANGYVEVDFLNANNKIYVRGV